MLSPHSSSTTSLQCNEELFPMDSPPPPPCSTTTRSNNKITTTPPIILCTSASSEGMTTATNDNKNTTTASEQKELPPTRYYDPLGHNANELSRERKRFHRMSLQAIKAASEYSQQAPWFNVFHTEESLTVSIGATTSPTSTLPMSASPPSQTKQNQQQRAPLRTISGEGDEQVGGCAFGAIGERRVTTTTTGPPLVGASANLSGFMDTPKGGVKVLLPIDVNNPMNVPRLLASSPVRHSSIGGGRGGRISIGSRLQRYFRQEQEQQRHCLISSSSTSSSSSSRHSNGAPMQHVILNEMPLQHKQQTQNITRKRRAAADGYSSASSTVASSSASECCDEQEMVVVSEKAIRLLNSKERLWVCADVDRAIHLDNRCLRALLEAETHVQVTDAQVRRQQQCSDDGGCNNGERGIDESARAQLVLWLQEVCESERADLVVLPLAVAFVDRMLAAKFLPRRNLQALGAACLLIASKLKAPQPILASKLADHYSGSEEEGASLTVEELLDWEMLVVNQLEWNLLQPTAFEFFDQLLVRSPMLETLREDFARCLHQMLRDLNLATQLVSVQAASCLLFCAFRSRKQHLLEESELAIRKHFALDSASMLFPMFDAIAKTLGVCIESLAPDKRILIDCPIERLTQPPCTKRMSIDSVSC